MVHHNGKKALSMGRDTTAVFVASTTPTEEIKWWNSLLSARVKRIIDIHDCEDDSVVNVAGIVGMLSSETKRVKSETKDLMTMRLTDRTGWVDVRSWNHSESEFSAFLEKPLLLQRVRVTSFAGLKICELIDGNGTVVSSSFEGRNDLEDYWQE
jgi:DNA polymerase III alpha subunit